jgi:hypothetical protein
MLVHLIGLSLITAAMIAGYFLVRYPHRGLRSILTVDDFGRLEAGIQSLEQVIVVADHVEPPQHELQRAVEQNFRRGTRYMFLVSKSNWEDEREKYYLMFESLARIAIKMSGKPLTVRDLVTIQPLPYEWPDVPHVFYKIRDEGGIRYVALRGNQAKEGIADFYSYLNPDYAHMRARSILSDVPAPIQVEEQEFATSNLVEFDPTRSATK